MSSCNNSSSNLSGNLNVNSITHSGARLLMTHPLSGFSGGRASVFLGDDGVTAGDAIRYDVDAASPSVNKYCKSKADMPGHAEVFGVVEDIDGEVVDVVLSGQIKFPNSKLVNATHIDPSGISGAAGGHDIYFLSEATGGAIQNLAPIEPTSIAKPILQKATDGDYTAHVVNYIGYQIGGQVIAEDPADELIGTVVDVLDFGGTNSAHSENSDWFNLTKTNWLPVSTESEYYKQSTGSLYSKAYANTFNNGEYGRRIRVTLTTVPSASVDGKIFKQTRMDGTSFFKGNIEQINKVNNTVTIKTTDTNDPSHNYSVKIDNSAYSIDPNAEVAILEFALPIRKSSQQSVEDIYGKDKIVQSIPSMQVTRDGGRRAVSIPQELTVTKLTIKDQLNVTSSTDSTTITDVGKVLRQINDDATDAMNKLNLTATSKNID
tara:strand:+ start:1917 stop:3215 length:1299 start_codon:yes stop_codon:yes gene_type:complete